MLRDAGWSTFWVGKNHNVPVDAFDIGANRKHWPLGLGYDRFYGFIGGETNQWYPELIEDNHFVDQPYSPEDGYHFSKDIADKAIGFIRDSKQSRPYKPWYMWYCPGANHAPHHAPKGYIEKYKGQFDDGTRPTGMGAGAHDREGRTASEYRSDGTQSDATRHVRRV